MRRIGSVLVFAGFAAFPSLFLSGAWADSGVKFEARVDRPAISLDDSVTLKLTVETEGDASLEVPKFKAPEFELVNEYTSSMVQSYYDNGRFGTRHQRQIMKVLKPMKEGTHTISGIEMRIDGKNYTAPSLTVRVGASGVTPSGPRTSAPDGKHPRYFIRAELSKERVYKGEQVIVGYYLYRRVRVFQIEVKKFPVFSGFLREDLELPVMGSRLDDNRVEVSGVPYERSLLASYAAYPLKEGKLEIDSMGLQLKYYGSGRSEDLEDPLASLFQQFTPLMGNVNSESVKVEVLPIPEAGKPASFSGAVGDFSVTSAVNRYEVKANEALTLTLKVEGRGNLSSLTEPKAKWPEGIELFESKGKTQFSKSGIGERVFEFLLIPRTPGKFTLPALEFSFFDPTTEKYVTKSTEPIDITVGEGAPGSAPPVKKSSEEAVKGAPIGGSAPKSEAMLDLKVPDAGGGQFRGLPWWRWMYLLCGFALLVFVGMVAVFSIKKRGAVARERREARSIANSKSWATLRTRAKKAANGASWDEVTQAYELLTGALFDLIDRRYNVGARALSRAELERILVGERGMSEDLWRRIARVLEFGEMVRFASSAGAVSENVARQELSKWVEESMEVEREMG